MTHHTTCKNLLDLRKITQTTNTSNSWHRLALASGVILFGANAFAAPLSGSLLPLSGTDASLLQGATIQASGTGWKKMSIPKASLMGNAAGEQIAKLPSDGKGLAADTVTIFIVESPVGLKDSPLPDVVKADLAQEFPATTPTIQSVSGAPTAGEPEYDPIIVHAGYANAVANGTQDQYKEFEDPSIGNEPTQFWCKPKWYNKEKSGTLDVNNLAKSFNLPQKGGFTGRVSGELPLSGKIDYKFQFAYRAFSCFKVPYSVRFNKLS